MAKAFFPEGIQKWPIEKWGNCHENFRHTFKKNASFKLVLPESVVGSADKYKATTANFMWLIRHAINNDMQMRAMGNGWSFSEVAVCEGGGVDTKALRLSFVLKNSFVSPEYLKKGKGSADLFFVQCGMSILQLNEKLEAAGRSLSASGASNGQSIAGATSTGTHGSAFKVGAVHDTIAGLHLIVGPDRHVWLERATNPVASDEFIDWLKAEKISNDELFNSAVVSFGSFGFIHGILLETEPLFLLEEHKSGELPYNKAFIHMMNTLEVNGMASTFTYPPGTTGKELYHIELLVNPHDFEPDNSAKGVYLKTIYKIPYFKDYPRRIRETKGFQYGDNTLGLVQTILDTLGPKLSAPLVPRLVNALLPLAFKETPAIFGTLGETFNNTRFRGKAASAAIGINASDASRVLEEIVRINANTPFAGAAAFRYVKGSAAIMAFTRFPITCILELDGVDSVHTRNFLNRVWERLEELDIPYTLHWGKINFNLNSERVRKMYGEAVDKWIGCRHLLLDEPSRKVFTNSFLQKLGMDG